ncbi:MAG: hypothetical protein HJJLKODD_01048 [Phycisphaerae bacterium]|nr:hypothetical protein [Phycisphaerae bacterium]
MKRLTIFVGIMGINLLGLAGCQQPTHQQHMTFLPASEHIASGSGYTLAPPDRVQIFSPQAREIDGEYTIRSDGTIRLKLLGNVRIAGLTAHEAAAKLQQELIPYYKNPLVDVSIDRYASKVFYVYGEIAGGGAGGGDRGAINVPITGRDTILTVLTNYPPSQNAALDNIHLIRPGKDADHSQILVINFAKMVSSGDRTQNYLLQEGDFLWVPPTPMAWVGYRIREILQPVNPVIEAYQTPASVKSADEVYEEDDNDNDNSGVYNNVLGRLRIP